MFKTKHNKTELNETNSVKKLFKWILGKKYTFHYMNHNHEHLEWPLLWTDGLGHTF